MNRKEVIKIGYQKTLSAMVQNSGLTLREIAEKCGKYGVKINPSYISKLQSLNQPPASDEVNIALSKACGINPDILLYEAYKEKAPELIRNFLEKSVSNIREIAALFSNEVYEILHFTDDQTKQINDEILNVTDLDIIRQFVQNPEQFNILNSILDTFNDEEDVEKEDTEFPLKVKINMPDDSMEPRIQRGSVIHYESAEYISNGDIVICKRNDGEILVRRYIAIENHSFLISENLDYSPLHFEKDGMELIGKVTHYTIKA